MISTRELQCPVSLMVSPPVEDLLEISRLLAAAVVNPSFCRLLLVDPEMAIENGYHGETFLISDAIRYQFVSINANSLAELAGQIVHEIGQGLHSNSSTFAPGP